ncbi:hypothetical protein KAR91_59810 [Candidatus Pacearchaeota archaeon]|nr:hypothetical protein [Candidatus Pacearchaeota archaeon]
MAITSKSQICQMAISQLGNYPSILDIDTPTTDPELIMAVWYDILRQFVLKMLMPNFALDRLSVAKLSETPSGGYAYYYEYPKSCLKILGIGDVQNKQNNYAVVGNKIATDEDAEDGLDIRIIRDIEDVNEFSPEYKLLLAQYIAAYTCLAITQDTTKAKMLRTALPQELSAASGLNAQENTPIRISRSRFKASRDNDSPTYTDKK